MGIGVHMSRHQHTAVGPLRYLWVFSVFALMHMEGMVLVDKLGDNLPLCVRRLVCTLTTGVSTSFVQAGHRKNHPKDPKKPS